MREVTKPVVVCDILSRQLPSRPGQRYHGDREGKRSLLIEYRCGDVVSAAHPRRSEVGIRRQTLTMLWPWNISHGGLATAKDKMSSRHVVGGVRLAEMRVSGQRDGGSSRLND